MIIIPTFIISIIIVIITLNHHHEVRQNSKIPRASSGFSVGLSAVWSLENVLDEKSFLVGISRNFNRTLILAGWFLKSNFQGIWMHCGCTKYVKYIQMEIYERCRRETYLQLRYMIFCTFQKHSIGKNGTSDTALH